MPTTRHVTLTAGDVTVVDLEHNFGRVEVLNRSGTAEVWFRVDGQPPEIGGDNTHVLPAAIAGLDVPDDSPGLSTVVRLISPGSPAVSVRGF